MQVPKGQKPGRVKPKRLQDKAHLKYVGSLPCCIPGCFATPVQVHHLLRSDPKRGTGRKAGDDHTIPLCFRHHADLHKDGNERVFLNRYRVGGPELARELWEASHD